jgi:glycosyltransferase involved in cell wall biosynthesis
LKQSAPSDLFRGALDWKRTWAAQAPRRNALWRYLPENIELLTRRMRDHYDRLPLSDAILQFGVAGFPPEGTPLIAHVEISIETAVSSEVFSTTYGFAGHDEALVRRAIEGERYFLSKCALIWTNSQWTANGLLRQGVPQDKLWVSVPGCGVRDPGEVVRDWKSPHLLFVGKVWGDKGGPLLAEAFKVLKKHYPTSQLTVIGCDPAISGDGIRVLGFLDKQDAAEAAQLQRAYSEANIFCMPSVWESVGVVYMEAAQYGLPVIMLRGQGREEIFPDSMAILLDNHDSASLADTLIQLAGDPEKMQAMGHCGRDYVLQNFTWPVIARRFRERACQITSKGLNVSAVLAS